VARFDDRAEDLRERGVRAVQHLYEDAGSALANSTVESPQGPEPC